MAKRMAMTQFTFYSRLTARNISRAASLVAALTNDERWYQRMDARFGDVWPEFAAFWKRGTGETPYKMSFYVPHNAAFLAEWASVKHPELLEVTP